MNDQVVYLGLPLSEAGNSYFRKGKKNYITFIIVGLAFMVGMYIVSLLNYRLFHSIADMIVVFIAASVFIIIWSGRHLLDNQYYLFIGIAFLYYAFFDFLHLIGNKGMGVFPEFDNLGPTFYIITRYFLSISFLLAPIFLKRKIKTAFVFIVYTLVSIIILISIFYWRNFPATYIEGVGLTRFKIISDYVVNIILLGAIGLLLHIRSSFDAKVFRLILLSLIVSIITGISFTLYTDPFGIINAGGHFLQIAAFYLVFLAFIDTGLAKPQDLLFHNLKQSNIKVQKLNTELAKVNNDLIISMAELEKKDLALKESEAQANTLIKYAPTAIFEYDFINQRFISVNEAMCLMSGYSREELYSLDPISLLDEQSAQSFYDRIRQQLEGKEQQEYAEYKIRKKDGSAMYVALNFSFIDSSLGIAVVISHDITTRRKYEDELRESEERFRVLSDTSPIGVIVTSSDGLVVYANNSYEALLGYEYTELIGSQVIDLYWNPEERTSWISLMLDKGIVRNYELRLKSKVGMPVWAQISASAISYGGAKAIMQAVQDISERKKADDELKRYAAELEASNKELESFAYSLSHDLRSPLRALDGFSQAILDDYSDRLDSAGKDYLTRIRESAQNMAQITEGMLELSRVIRNDLRWETVNLSDMVSEIVKGLRGKEPDRKIEITIAPNVFTKGDPNLLHIALYNLIENSWKFSSKSPQAQIEFAKVLRDNTNVYFVKDNGIGFNMQYADKLFLPFQRLHADADFFGHGIGLATVHRVISRHGGKIWTDSEVGKGTAIYFTLGNYGFET